MKHFAAKHVVAKHLVALIGGIVIPIIFASAASACRCKERPEAEQIARNDLIIEGKVIEVTPTTRLGRKVLSARIEVTKAVKGTSRHFITVQAFEYVGECSVPFKPNEPIKLMARRRGNIYRTTICKIYPAGV